MPRAALRRFTQAFLLSAVATVPAFLWRAAGGSPAADLIAALSAILAAAFMTHRAREASDRIVAAGIGAAAGFGLAAHFETGVPSVFLHGPLVMLSALAGTPLLKSIGDWILRIATTPPWGQRPEVMYYWVIPWLIAALTAAAAPLLAAMRTMRRPAPGPLTTGDVGHHA
jgi:hypothetical protein